MSPGGYMDIKQKYTKSKPTRPPGIRSDASLDGFQTAKRRALLTNWWIFYNRTLLESNWRRLQLKKMTQGHL
jgi:hypothetical protein